MGLKQVSPPSALPARASPAWLALLCLLILPGAAFATPLQSPPIDTPPHVAQRDQLVQQNYIEAIKHMTEQFSVVMLQQLPIIGAFMDAKHQLETQRLFGLTAANAHRDYQPSEAICAFGTLARSTAAARHSVNRNVEGLQAVLMKRELLNANVSSAWGPFADASSRMEKFKVAYCDVNDNNKTLTVICPSPGPQDRRNKDIDFRRVIENNMTLDVDFLTGGAPTLDEEDVIALAKNLYSHETLTSIQERAIVPYGSYRELHDSRALSAVRSVARHSYATMAGMRARGSGIASAQLRQVMENLGVPAGDIDGLIGTNPSYFAQMEIFTQKMFQDPQFIVNLYHGPANVARTGLVLQGIRLMHDRDRFEASLRREMLLSMILEMKLRERQEEINNNINKLGSVKD